MPGPVPNREDDLARDRKRKGSEQVPVTRGVMYPVVVPDPDPNWHPIALMLWQGLTTSGQREFYQNSDWAFAWSLCEDLSRYKEPLTDKEGNEYFKRSGQMLQTIYTAMDRLLVTEADRRRVRIELHEAPSEEASASVTAIEEYKRALELVPDSPETTTS
jgi:hypothetical protein